MAVTGWRGSDGQKKLSRWTGQVLVLLGYGEKEGEEASNTEILTLPVGGAIGPIWGTGVSSWEVKGTGLGGNCSKDRPGIRASGPGAGGGNPEQESRLSSAEGPKQNPQEMPTWKPGSSPQRRWLPGLNRALPPGPFLCTVLAGKAFQF